jgi:hypothetical protein
VDGSGNELISAESYIVVPAVSTGTPAPTPPPTTTAPPATTPPATPPAAPGGAPSTYTYPSGVAAYDLVRGSGTSAVYFVANGKRYVFPDQMVYRSWYADFSGVKTISAGALAALPLGAAV